jgi:hypothetical protein
MVYFCFFLLFLKFECFQQPKQITDSMGWDGWPQSYVFQFLNLHLQVNEIQRIEVRAIPRQRYRRIVRQFSRLDSCFDFSPQLRFKGFCQAFSKLVQQHTLLNVLLLAPKTRRQFGASELKLLDYNISKILLDIVY